MKRYMFVFALLLVLAMGVMGQAQSTPANPQDPKQEKIYRLQQSIQELESIQERVVALPSQVQGRGGRGSAPVTINQFRLRPDWTTNGLPTGAWWTNTSLVERLGLTDDQKAKIERTFENHRQQIVSTSTTLEEEETRLQRLLEAETLDRNAVLTQIDRVVQARSEVERANSAMTLEMREHLTRAQWMQLQSPSFQIRRVGGAAQAENLIYRVDPIYPESAKQAAVRGAVILEAEINKEGTVDSVKVVSGHPLLQQAALDAVKQWRFKPTLLNGLPVPVVTTITVSFPPAAGGQGERGAAPSPSSPAQGGQRRGPRPQ